MKILIVEDSATGRLLLQALLKPYGTCDLAADGKEGIEAVRAALKAREPYDLICLDIMMPEVDGHQVLKTIRVLEAKARMLYAVEEGQAAPSTAKIVMMTALSDMGSVLMAREGQCDHYLVKPIQKAKLLEVLRKLELVD